MKATLHSVLLLIFLLIFHLSVIAQKKKWKGQGPIQKTGTTTLPTQKQFKGIFKLSNGVYCANNFAGARLNGAVANNDTLVTALIMPENTPINPSPWYAFKIWSQTKKQIYLKLTYLDKVRHRYYPKLSKDGKQWTKLKASNYFEGQVSSVNNFRKLPYDITMKLNIGPDTLWVAAQEVINSAQAQAWGNQLSRLPFVSTSTIGQSREGRPIHLLKIGQANDKKMMMVISRQHPPEVTGFLAMQAFVETICSHHKTAQRFRKVYNTYVVPMVNPDGVDNGHWRHSTAGVDLNRDWETAHQPEVTAVQKFMQNKVSSTQGKFYFGVDFHSTWEDIYYTIHPSLKGNMPDLVPETIKALSKDIKGYDPNIRPRKANNRSFVTSYAYFFFKYQAEALTFEIGDNTPRKLLKKKGKLAALKLMELMLRNHQK